MNYGYNPETYMNPYPNMNFPVYRSHAVTQIPGPQLDKVNGMDSARAFPMKPNSTIALFDANEDIMYIKSTDSNNFATIRRFRFVEEPEAPVLPMNTNTGNYVTKEEFDKFREEVLNGQQSVRTNKSNAESNGNKHKSNESASANKKHDDSGSK